VVLLLWGQGKHHQQQQLALLVPLMLLPLRFQER
jgi:hypothetical protein